MLRFIINTVVVVSAAWVAIIRVIGAVASGLLLRGASKVRK